MAFVKTLIDLARWKKQLMAGLADFFCLWLAAWLAFVIRLGEDIALSQVQWLFIGLAPALALPGFIWSGLYRSVIRFVGEQALFFIAKGVLVATLAWIVFAALLSELGAITGMPRTVPVIYMVLAFALVAGTRFSARWLLWKTQRTRFGGRQALIFGAGLHGKQVAIMLRHGVEFFPAGYIDSNEELWGKDIGGMRVYSPKDIGMLIRRFEISDVVLSEDAFKARSRREIMRLLEPYPVHVRLAPNGLSIDVNRGVALHLAELDPIDLLDREPKPDPVGSLASLYEGSVVLVTGAAGSIGGEICRRVLKEKPSKLVLLDNSETGLYQILLELMESLRAMGLNHTAIEPVLADIRNKDRLTHIFQDHKPEFVFHAAAYKHVPLIEQNAVEGVRVNVFGTLNCLSAAAQINAKYFVLISTDKAVNPSSVMGMSKRVAELMILVEGLEAIPKTSNTIFSVVRFGNVLDSSGSVIPVFRRQIAVGGPLTVTHPDVTRYFMTIPQAVSLVLRTPMVCEHRDVLVLEMGPPVKILDIAQRMIRFSGLRVKNNQHPDGDIEISFTGLRPGEKLHEDLTYNATSQKTLQPGILRFLNECHGAVQGLEFQLRALEKNCAENDVKQVIRLLKMLSPSAQEENARAEGL